MACGEPMVFYSRPGYRVNKGHGGETGALPVRRKPQSLQNWFSGGDPASSPTIHVNDASLDGLRRTHVAARLRRGRGSGPTFAAAPFRLRPRRIGGSAGARRPPP